MLQVILTNQNKNEHTLESIKDISSKQAEEVKMQLQQQQQHSLKQAEEKHNQFQRPPPNSGSPTEHNTY